MKVSGVTGDLLRVDDRLHIGAPYSYSLTGNQLEFVFAVPLQRIREPWTHFELQLGSETIIRPIGWLSHTSPGDTLTIVQRVEVYLRP